MESWYFIAGLSLMTLIAVLVWAAVSKHRTEQRLEDPNASKSSLAKDGPGPNPATAPRVGNGGVSAKS